MHLMIDSGPLDVLLAAGDAQQRALANRLCCCEWNVPYDSGQVERVKVATCFRCRAIAMWSEARNGIAPARNESCEKGGQVEADALRLSPTALAGVHATLPPARVLVPA